MRDQYVTNMYFNKKPGLMICRRNNGHEGAQLKLYSYSKTCLKCTDKEVYCTVL